MNAAKKIKSEFVKAASDDYELASFIKTINVDDLLERFRMDSQKFPLRVKEKVKRTDTYCEII